MTSTPADYMPALLARLQHTAPEESFALLYAAAEQHPRDPRPVLLLAAELVHAREIDRAEAAYLVALQRAPDWPIARFQLGLLQFTCARPAAALATWAPLERLAQDDPLRLFKAGIQALLEGRTDEARRLVADGLARNTVNAPLNRDMQLLLERVDELAAASRGAARAAPIDAPSPEGGHLFMNAYRTR